GDEEEDGEQSICGPGAEAEVEVERLRPDLVVAQLQIRLPPPRVRPHGRGNRAGDEQESAGGLRAQDVGDPGALEERPALEEAGTSARLRHGRPPGSAG